MTDRITLINRALTRIGASPLLSDTIAAAVQYVAIYDGVTERLAAHPFTFLRRTVRLVQKATAPVAVWAYAYQLPADMLGPPRAVYARSDTDQPLTSYDIAGDELLANEPQIWIAYPSTGAAARWPGDFRELHTVAMMAELALSVREDRALHDRLYQKAFGSPGQNGLGGLLAAALENDAQGTPSITVGAGVNPLIDVRY